MSPDLFHPYREMVLKEVQRLERFKFGGYNITHIRFADDTALVAVSAEKLQHMLDMTMRASEERGLTVNMGKSKELISRENSLGVSLEARRIRKELV